VASILVFAATGLALVSVALCFAALGRRFDEDGGPVVYARAAFGETASFLVGWVAYVSALASTSAVTAGVVASVAPGLGLAGIVAERGAAALTVALLALLCLAGIRVSARTWTALTVLKMLPLLALVAAFAAQGVPQAAAAPPSGAGGGASLLHAALTAAFTYQGFEIVPVVAGQVRSPERVVPRATVWSLVIAAALYVVIQAACVFALPALATTSAPLSDTAAVIGGPSLASLVSAGAIVSTVAICFAMMVVTPRYLSALAKGDALAFHLDRMAPNGVPQRALGVTWLLVTILVLSVGRAQLFVLSGLAVQMQYVVSALALGVLARRRAFGLTWREGRLAVPAMIVGLALAAGATTQEWLVTAAFVVLGVLLRAVR
jgi:amino acid transporter